ncbi:MAG: FAD-dependent oxidoreductase [Cyanobacteria bacterium J007]|nr:MAG: FAD-dependent oxidoreductase [Cyanobacteria bacterium J007]
MNPEITTLDADVLVVGGGTGGTAAAIQAARRGANTILVGEGVWLGGMLTSAGVCAPDGNELAAFQTGLWGAFLRELERRQVGGLNRGWVSFFTYDPRVGAAIFADWVRELPNLHWIRGQVPREVLRDGDRPIAVRFDTVLVRARIILDGTELGDLLPLAEIPYRWGWEWRDRWNEPSAPVGPNALTRRYPVQAPTWVAVLRDFGEGEQAPPVPVPEIDRPELFAGAWDAYGPRQFLDYARLPGDLFLLNWPIRGNDYGEGLDRLVTSETARSQFLQEALWHSQSFALYVQNQLGRRYGLAEEIFPPGFKGKGANGGGAFALHPYYRESRRIEGLETLTERDILPMSGGRVARLPGSERVSAVAIGNYENDHHYPETIAGDFKLQVQRKSIRWGGRLTGTPFAIPYGCLVPAATDGFLVCEKNISVSHIANGATRLQPAVMGIGQAAGMAAALCVERGCEPRELPVRELQEALLTDAIAPTAVIPLFDLTRDRPDWLDWQRYYLDCPQAYPLEGETPTPGTAIARVGPERYVGVLQRLGEQDYRLTQCDRPRSGGEPWILVTLYPDIERDLREVIPEGEKIAIAGRSNCSGGWILVEAWESR